MNKITAIIPAKNEEGNIERCIKSLNWCDKVVVLWMGSDKTGEIANKLGAEVIERNKKEQDDFIAVQENINWAIDHATTDWILRIDADEVVTSELKEEILNLLRTHNSELKTLEPVAYGIPRKQYFWGGFLKGGDWAYDRLTRLFKPKYVKYDPIVSVHEQLKVNGTLGYLKNALNHYSHPTLDVAIKKFNVYTSLEINALHYSLVQAQIRMIILPFYIFMRWIIWHHGYRDGMRGIVAGAMRSWYEFILYTKYIERNFSGKQ